MPEPPVHYQVSFTSRQAVLLFVVALVALAGAYLLGLATGLAGRPPSETAAAAQPTPAPVSTARPKRASGAPIRSSPATTAPAAAEGRRPAPAVAVREPAAPGGLQFFEDRPKESAPTLEEPAPVKEPGGPAASAGGFWVQVLSTTSEREANSSRTRLSARGHRAAVEPVRSAKGPILYRVRVGPYASREEASRAAEALVRTERVNTWIVPPGR